MPRLSGGDRAAGPRWDAMARRGVAQLPHAGGLSEHCAMQSLCAMQDAVAAMLARGAETLCSSPTLSAPRPASALVNRARSH